MERQEAAPRFPSKEVATLARTHLKETHGALGQFLGAARESSPGSWTFDIHGRTQEIEDTGVIGSLTVNESTGEVVNNQSADAFSKNRLAAMSVPVTAYVVHLLQSEEEAA